MSEKMLLSFVIPVYNVEKYLNECLDSIFDQSAEESDYEVIAVDDGSTDRCPEILKAYLHYKNFRLVTQENNGLGAARNVGIKAAKGQYISFVDSDDYLISGAVPILLGYAANSDCDVVEFRCQNVNEKGNYLYEFGQPMNKIPHSGKGKDVFVSWYERGALTPTICTRIFKRDWIIENGLYFREHIFQEDTEWSYRVFFYTKTVAFHPDMIYSYRRREDSISNEKKNDIKRCFDYLVVIDSLVEFWHGIEHNEENQKYISMLGDRISALLATAISYFCKSRSLAEHRKAIFLELEKRRPLFSLATHKKRRRLYKLTRLLPTPIAFNIYRIM